MSTRVAIIEDNADNRMLLEALLADRYEIDEYADGIEGLAGMLDDRVDLRHLHGSRGDRSGRNRRGHSFLHRFETVHGGLGNRLVRPKLHLPIQPGQRRMIIELRLHPPKLGPVASKVNGRQTTRK